MVTVTCDMCGKEIHSLTSRVDLEFTYNGVNSVGTRLCDTQRQLCITCATRVIDWIGNRSTERTEGEIINEK